MIKRILLGTSVLISAFSAYAQNVKVCGTDQYHEEQKALNPDLKAAEAQAMAVWNAYKHSDEYRIALGKSQKKSSAPKYIIPVVVHVFYGSPGSSDNISDAQIQSEIATLNKSFRNLNSDTVNRRKGEINGMPFDFKQTAGDAEIEFRLARKDPNGNCTNGIVRVQSSNFADGNDNLKRTSVWDTKRYFNMWVVNSINRGPGLAVAGYAQFPFFAGGAWSALTDGIMVINREFGNVGTSSPGQTPNVTTTTHEAGHWLGLFHPFQAQDSCESENDGIDDTPPTFFDPTPTEPLRNRCNIPSFNTCNNDKYAITISDTIINNKDTTIIKRDSLIAWDRPDMQENFMDYFIGNCASNMFTRQQIARMHKCIELYRRQMVSQENLISTGVLDPVTACAPVPAFGITVNNLVAYERQACVGTEINFVDLSYNGTAGTAFEWNFGEGANPQTSTAKNPTSVIYNNAGNKTITLKVTNAAGTTTKVFENALLISASESLNDPAYNYDYPTVADGWIFKGDATRKWEETSNGVFAGYKGIKLRGNSNAMTGTAYSIVSPSFNFENTTNPYIKFNYSFAPNITTGTTTSSDQMVVQFSVNCGLFWSNLRTLNVAALQTVPSPLSALVDFVPVNQSQWKEVLVSGATIPKSANVRFRINFFNEGGNNLYIDNISFGKKVGVDELNANDINLTVYPNPFNTTTQISYNLPAAAQTSVEVYDLIGKKVANLFNGKQNEGVQQVTFDRTRFGLTNGMYFVKIKVGESIITQKVMVN